MKASPSRPWTVVRRLGVGGALLLALLGAVAAFALNVGGMEIPPGRVLQALWHALVGGQPADLGAAEWAVVREAVVGIRLPRVLLGALVGFALASVGAALQGLLLNPLADPHLIGVSSGAGLGAALAITLGLEEAALGFAVPLGAFALALVALWLVLLLARRGGRVRPESFLIAGVAVGAFCWAGITAVLSVAGEDMQRVLYWLLGSLSLRERFVAPLALLLCIGWPVLLSQAHRLNLLALGDEAAQQLGVAVERTRAIVIVTAALVTAAAVSVSGLIGFVGLMVPHMLRRVVGPDLRVLLPLSALGGASFLILADVAARLLPRWAEAAVGHAVADLPVGVVTALLGGPLMFVLLRRGVREPPSSS